MSLSEENPENIHLDGNTETATVLTGVTSDDINEEKPHLGNITIENNTYAYGLKDIEAETVGSVKVPTNTYETGTAIHSSTVNQVNGDLTGKTVINNSNIGKIEGDITFGNKLASQSHNITLHGNITKDEGNKRTREGIFVQSNIPTVVADKVEGKNLDRNSVGGLIVTDELDVDNTEDNMFTVAPQSSRRRHVDATFPARPEHQWEEWQDFKQEIKEKEDELYGLKILGADNLSAESQEEADRIGEISDTNYNDDRTDRFRSEFFAMEQYRQEILEEELDFNPQDAMDEIGERIGHLEAFGEFNNRRYADLLNEVVQAQEQEADNLGNFGVILDGTYSDGIDTQSKQELLDRLQNDDLLNVADNLRYDMSTILQGELEELVNSQGELPEVEELKEDWENWNAWKNGYTSLGGMLETAYEENKEEIANLAYLADFLQEDLELDTQEWVAQEKKKKTEGKDYEIDNIDDIEQALKEEIEDKKRELTVEALEKLGEYDALPSLNKEYGFTPFLTSEKEEKGFAEFTGDETEWENFVEKLESLNIDRTENNGSRLYRSINPTQLDNEFFGIPILEPDIDQISSWNELQNIEEESQEALYAELNDVESSFEEVASETRNIQSYSFLDPRYKSQILSKLVDDTANEDDTKGKYVSGFGQSLARLDENIRNEFLDALKTDTDKAVAAGKVNEHGLETEYSDGDSKFGNHLFDIAVNREYSFFVDDETERIEDLMDVEGDLPGVDSFFEEDSPYREIVEELTSEEHLENGEDSEYGEMPDEELADKLRTVRGLAERLDFEYDGSDVFGMLKGKEGQRQNTDFEPSEEDLDGLLANRRKELEKDVQNKLREYVKQGVQNLGFEAAVDEYEDATGQRTDELEENEISALKVRKRFNGRKVETVDKLLQHQNNVYQLQENQEWLEEHGFTEDELIDPDLSSHADDTYEQAENSEYDSALQVNVDPDDVELDTEREKQQYWEELTTLLDEAGVEEEVNDVEQAEEAIVSIEEPEDENLYNELKDVLNNYQSVESRESGVPDELTLRVSDPMDTTRMGHGFGSCHDIDGGSYAWASISNAVDANKMVFYAEDEQGRERARVKAFITEDEEMVYHNTSQYKDIDIDTSDYFEDYMSKVADNLGLDLKHSNEVDYLEDKVELLEADDWYSGS